MNIVTLDFETYYDVKCSLTKLTIMEYVKHPMFKVWGVGVQVNDEQPGWFAEEDVEWILDDIDWDDSILVCHNTLFDGYILNHTYKHLGVKPTIYADTAAMARGLWPGQSAALKNVVERCFPNDPHMRKGEELVKAKGIYDLPPDIENEIANYCVQDVNLTRAIHDEMLRFYNFPEFESRVIDLTTRIFCEPQLKTDKELLVNFLKEQKQETIDAIESSGLDRATLASNQKFAAWAKEQGLDVPEKESPATGKMIPAFGKNDAAFKQWKREHDEYDHVFKARERVKSRLNETRAERFLSNTTEDGYLPTPLKYYAAHTGRFGGAEKINLQNLPRNSPLRKALTAPLGKLLYVADLSQIEARLLAWISGQKDLVEDYRKGVDIYSSFASGLYGYPVSKERPEERFVGKTAILGLGYGMGANKFRATCAQADIQVTQQFAQNTVDKYRSTYSYIPEFWNRSTGMLRFSTDVKPYYYNEKRPMSYNYKCLSVVNNGIRLPNGLALRYPDLQLLSYAKLSYKNYGKVEYTYGGRITENIVQALARIVICEHMLKIQSYTDLDVVLTVHDEIVALGDARDPQIKLDNMIKIMTTPPSWAPDLPLAAEGGWDTCYSK